MLKILGWVLVFAGIGTLGHLADKWALDKKGSTLTERQTKLRNGPGLWG